MIIQIVALQMIIQIAHFALVWKQSLTTSIEDFTVWGIMVIFLVLNR